MKYEYLDELIFYFLLFFLNITMIKYSLKINFILISILSITHSISFMYINGDGDGDFFYLFYVYFFFFLFLSISSCCFKLFVTIFEILNNRIKQTIIYFKDKIKRKN